VEGRWLILPLSLALSLKGARGLESLAGLGVFIVTLY